MGQWAVGVESHLTPVKKHWLEGLTALASSRLCDVQIPPIQLHSRLNWHLTDQGLHSKTRLFAQADKITNPLNRLV